MAAIQFCDPAGLLSCESRWRFWRKYCPLLGPNTTQTCWCALQNSAQTNLSNSNSFPFIKKDPIKKGFLPPWGFCHRAGDGRVPDRSGWVWCSVVVQTWCFLPSHQPILWEDADRWFFLCWSLGKCKWFSYVSCSSHSVRTSMAHMMNSFLDMRSTNRPLLMRQAARNGKPARLVWPCVSIRGLVTEFLSHLFSDMNWYNIAYCHSTVIHSKSVRRYFHFVSFGNFHAGRIQRFWIGPASWELWICWFWSLFWKGGEYFPLKPDGTPGSCGQKNQPLTRYW